MVTLKGCQEPPMGRGQPRTLWHMPVSSVTSSCGFLGVILDKSKPAPKHGLSHQLQLPLGRLPSHPAHTRPSLCLLGPAHGALATTSTGRGTPGPGWPWRHGPPRVSQFLETASSSPGGYLLYPEPSPTSSSASAHTQGSVPLSYHWGWASNSRNSLQLRSPLRLTPASPNLAWPGPSLGSHSRGSCHSPLLLCLLTNPVLPHVALRGVPCPLPSGSVSNKPSFQCHLSPDLLVSPFPNKNKIYTLKQQVLCKFLTLRLSFLSSLCLECLPTHRKTISPSRSNRSLTSSAEPSRLTLLTYLLSHTPLARDHHNNSPKSHVYQN